MYLELIINYGYHTVIMVIICLYDIYIYNYDNHIVVLISRNITVVHYGYHDMNSR